MNMNRNNYTNKYFSILGDSISTLEGYSTPENASYYDTAHKLASGVIRPSDTWWGQVIECLDGKLLINNSIAGSTVCRHPLYEFPSYGCSNERTASLDKDGIFPDVILLFMGFNDWGCGTAIAYDEKITDAKDKDTYFLGAYETMLEKLQKNYPSAEIWCFTLPVSQCSRNEDFEFPYTYRGRHIEEYCNAIRVCSKKYGCRLIDLYSRNVRYDTLDNFHPNAEGMMRLADATMKEVDVSSPFH